VFVVQTLTAVADRGVTRKTQVPFARQFAEFEVLGHGEEDRPGGFNH